MFNCAVCEMTFGPRVKPIRVIAATEPVSYHNVYYTEDEWGNKTLHKVDSVGTEIRKELLVCAEDAEKEFHIPQPKPGPAQKPVYAFQEKLAPPLPVTFAAVMVHNALERTRHKSKRAERDSRVAVPMVKSFVDANPKLVF